MPRLRIPVRSGSGARGPGWFCVAGPSVAVGRVHHRSRSVGL